MDIGGPPTLQSWLGLENPFGITITSQKPRLADWGTGDKMGLNWGGGDTVWGGTGGLLTSSPAWPTSDPTAGLDGSDALMQMFR